MEALQSLSGFLSGPNGQAITKLGEIGTAGAGLYGNLSGERQAQKERDYLTKQQNTLADPTALANKVAAATQPLNRGLVESVGNQVSGTLAEQGLGQAPGIQGTVLAQALAPFEQQNQATALQLVMKQLGLPIEYAQTLLANMPKQTNLAPLLALLQKGATPGAGSGTAIDPSNIGALMKLLQSGQMPGQTPTTSSYDSSLISPSGTSPDLSSALPDWLSSAPATSTLGA